MKFNKKILKQSILDNNFTRMNDDYSFRSSNGDGNIIVLQFNELNRNPEELTILLTLDLSYIDVVDLIASASLINNGVFETVDLNYASVTTEEDIYFSLRKNNKEANIIVIIKGLVLSIKGLHVLDIFISYLSFTSLSIDYNLQRTIAE